MAEVFSIENAAAYAFDFVRTSFLWTGLQVNGAKTLWKRSPWRFRKSIYRFVGALVDGDFDPTHPYRRVYGIPEMGTLPLETLKHRVGIGTGDNAGRLVRGRLSESWVGGRPVFEYLQHVKYTFVRIHPYFYRRIIRELWVTGELTSTRVEEILRQS